MTTRGRGLIREALLGGVAEEIIRTSVAPVLFVGPRFDTGWELSDSPLVLAGIDGSTPSLAAARAAGDLAAAIGGRVRVIEVLRPSDVVAVGDFPGGDVAMLEAAVADLSARGVAADYEIVDGFDAADTLADRATAGQPTVIAVASHGRTGLARAVLGSVAMRTLRHARCPVLVTGPGVHRHAADGAAVNSTHDAAPT